MEELKADSPKDFIRTIVAHDVETKKFDAEVRTRFPPEPNGYLHIGHAKSMCLNFGVAEEFPGGLCNLRFDDTNPTKENVEYVASIQADVQWLGFDWGSRLYYASDYFERLYDYAVFLIKQGQAYVDSLNADQIREHRGTLTEPGTPSPFRTRSIEENLDLFARMRAGEFPDGAHVLRAKIDMASPNINLRDPILYRIRRAHHHRTGDAWCMYPNYDFAHPLSDSIESITHSLCTLEFEDHRPLYDWVLNACQVERHSQQIEFARLNLTYTLMSKRKLLELVEEGHVSGWDDPRLPTLMGLRRRGYTPESIRAFCDHIGVAKRDSTTEMKLLEHFIREDLNRRAMRVMAVLRPLRLVIENYPEGQVEELMAVNNPEDPTMGKRTVPFSRVLYIEQDDFREDPPKKFFRLAPGQEVRLRYAYIIKCTQVIKDSATGEIQEVHCTYDPETRSGGPQASRKVKGTLHWVSAEHAIQAEVRLYDHLFLVPDPGNDKGGKDYRDHLNPHSMERLSQCYVEPSLGQAKADQHFQFERQGYFCADSVDSSEGRLVFNRTVALRDSWSKIEKEK
ncbi:glutamine--tRNA ligase/YqeY domain fusion protein [Candidatus Nitronereus thalassa]|uniref:Glutamine--tRNA ligase n=1 Tax=Candidatus Nitronereus thalassa TaxID=3020898 RepID=A0ABU3K724_9BACT|nr:glutamine--tRNA ligase/YqeY domain fusion protein [Candidatus Nitronereus thalassa]MDT7042195.1 glutamine--tRNA ligase/YqeY domain fusion protein [Candidatus Nitronereus thalassa]